MSKLTDRGPVSGLSLLDIFHIVKTGDTTQSPQGSSYHANLQDVKNLIGGTSGNYYWTSGSTGVS